MWTAARKLEAAIEAPRVAAISRSDTRRVVRPGWYQVITPSATGWLNEIVHSEVDDADAERVIDEAIATYHPLGRPVKWCVGPWTRPDGFGERLARRGFESWNVSGMGIATSVRLEAARGVRVREIAGEGSPQSREDLARFVDAAIEGWGIPREQRPFDLEGHADALSLRPRLVHLFVAEDVATDECIGTAGIVLRGDYGYLVGTQVLARARGRGAYRALVAARLSFLAARGVEYAVTHARDETSAPILERLGFERLFRSACWLLPPPA